MTKASDDWDKAWRLRQGMTETERIGAVSTRQDNGLYRQDNSDRSVAVEGHLTGWLYNSFHSSLNITYRHTHGYVQTDGRTDGRTDRQTDRQTDSQTVRQSDRQTDRDWSDDHTLSVQLMSLSTGRMRQQNSSIPCNRVTTEVRHRKQWLTLSTYVEE